MKNKLISFFIISLIFITSQSFAFEQHESIKVYPKNSFYTLIPKNEIDINLNIYNKSRSLINLRLALNIDEKSESLCIWDNSSGKFKEEYQIKQDSQQNYRIGNTCYFFKSISIQIQIPKDIMDFLSKKIDYGRIKAYTLLFSTDGIDYYAVCPIYLVKLPEIYYEEKSQLNDDPVKISKKYIKSFDSKYFGCFFEANSGGRLNKSGSSTNLNTNSDVKIFSKKFDFFDAKASAAITAPYCESESNAGIELDFNNKTIYSNYLKKEFSDKKSFTKSLDYIQLIPIGPIPLKIKGGVEGEIGVEYKLKLDNNLLTEVKPFLNTAAFASASVDAVIIDVGVKGKLSFLKDELTLKTQCPLEVKEDFMNACLQFDLSNEIFGPSGTIWAYVEHYEPGICIKSKRVKVSPWHKITIKIPYLCPKKKNSKITIASWDSAYQYKQNLINSKFCREFETSENMSCNEL